MLSGGRKGGTPARSARRQAADREREAEIASLPVATVQISVTGHVTGEWSGQLHWARNDISPGRPEPTDPYADRKLVWFELFARASARPDLGGLPLRHWSFQIPGFHGDDTYDLTAINREREAAGAALQYLEWAMHFADSDETTFYFNVDAGQSAVTVSKGGKQLDAVVAMRGARGDLIATATIAVQV
jgi:hypothetical protein